LFLRLVVELHVDAVQGRLLGDLRAHRPRADNRKTIH
jgi:hypothetical protein